MTELERMLQGDTDDFERALLASADLDEPPPRLLARVAAAVGVSGAALTHASTASAGVATALVLKYVGVGIVG
jgi:hypothetical protein